MDIIHKNPVKQALATDFCPFDNPPRDTPRDRDGTFEPQLIAKHQRRVPGFDEKILALYAKGMTTRDIR